ncbi:hypothetical protein [Streptomyces sp. NPDC051776]|uniref:hypothetical protein n=1 Tax=Streptomyces sp. NPDC051776 TaxID=3155414 RepID=UPI003425195F
MSPGDDDYGHDYPGEARDAGRGTRTRLPEGAADAPYGAARRPRGAGRPSRSMITIVGVVVLLIAAIAFVNRGGDDSGGSGSDSSGDAAKAQPTAPTGEKPVPGSDAGIASGFPKTEQGAQSAAANYAVALGGDGMFNAEARKEIVDRVYAPDVAADRQDDLDRVYSDEKFLAGIGLETDGSAPADMTFVSRTNPIGTRLEDQEGDTATVAVWFSTLFGLAGEGSKNPVAESWYTNTFQLRWVDGDWKVTDFKQEDGPTPVGRDQAASSAEDMADAVEGFGGFTYAR